MKYVRGAAERELLVVAFGEIADDVWAQEEESAVRHFRDRLESYPAGPIRGEVAVKNIGRGADWTVVAIAIASAAGTAFFAIPKAHKAIRTSLAEWGRIVKEVQSVYAWIVGDRKALYPDSYLFLLALEQARKRRDGRALTYLGVKRLPEDKPDLHNLESLLFSFRNAKCIDQVAISREGRVLWHNEIPISAPKPPKSLRVRRRAKK
ncbi:MAG: hypothetical protein AB7O31_02760 [Burkholderiales bacterium]